MPPVGQLRVTFFKMCACRHLSTRSLLTGAFKDQAASQRRFCRNKFQFYSDHQTWPPCLRPAAGLAAVELGWYRHVSAELAWPRSLGWQLTDSLPSKLAWTRTREVRAPYSDDSLWQHTSRHSIFPLLHLHMTRNG